MMRSHEADPWAGPDLMPSVPLVELGHMKRSNHTSPKFIGSVHRIPALRNRPAASGLTGGVSRMGYP